MRFTDSQASVRLALMRIAPFPALVLLSLTSIASAQNLTVPLFSWQEQLHGNDDNKLRWPVALSTSDSNEIAVADAYGSRLFLFKDGGGTIGWKLQAVADLPATPVGVAFDGERYLVSLREPGSLLAADRPQLRFRKISLPAGTVPGAIAVAPDGVILVFDFASQAVLLVDSKGSLQRSVPVGAFVTAVALGSGGDFFVSTVEPGEIRRYSMAGALLGSWQVPGLGPAPSWPVGVASRTGGEIVVADRKGHRVVVLESGGQLAGTGSRWGWEAGLLRRPSDIAMLADGRLVVADQGNGRVQIFRPEE